MADFRSSRPPAAPAVGQWVVADHTQLRPLRTSLRETLSTQTVLAGDDLDDLVERMAIVATELSSNTLRHAGPPAVVTLSRTKNAFVLDVADDQPSAPPRVVDRSTGMGGRGLRIVQALALKTGWYATAGHKHVWAQFGVPRTRVMHAPRISVFDLDRFTRLFRRLRP